MTDVWCGFAINGHFCRTGSVFWCNPRLVEHSAFKYVVFFIFNCCLLCEKVGCDTLRVGCCEL
uniref:Uncharacterized protein n=1 Tax=Anguilla anguilla TaxID=7936 RepID=A0A0E9W137_ANGAN